MVRFRDLQTGDIVEVTDRPRITNRRQRRDRFQELHDDTGGVPDGTIADVLAWVGDDDRRRRTALAAEQAGRRRKTLLDALS